MNAPLLEKALRAKVERHIEPALKSAYEAWSKELAKFGLTEWELHYSLKPEKAWSHCHNDGDKYAEKVKSYEAIVASLVTKGIEALIQRTADVAEVFAMANDIAARVQEGS